MWHVYWQKNKLSLSPAPIAMCLTIDWFNYYANWPVWLKMMTSQAKYLHALQPFSSKNALCTETLSCPAIAVENNVFMTSHHDSSFSAHWPCPGWHFEPAIGSSATHQKSLTTGIIASQWKFLEIIQTIWYGTEKTQSLYEKTLIVPKRAVFKFFPIVNGGGGFDSQNPPVRTPLIGCAAMFLVTLKQTKSKFSSVPRGVLRNLKNRGARGAQFKGMPANFLWKTSFCNCFNFCRTYCKLFF